jgi:hypothetical protein
MLLGDAILVPITEVGSVACAIGWAAACASCLALARPRSRIITLSATELAVATFGLIVAVAMALMKLIPQVPGHFTIYEWLALGAWILLGVIASCTKASAATAPVPRASRSLPEK